jgi:hypothetical protein
VRTHCGQDGPATLWHGCGAVVPLPAGRPLANHGRAATTARPPRHHVRLTASVPTRAPPPIRRQPPDGADPSGVARCAGGSAGPNVTPLRGVTGARPAKSHRHTPAPASHRFGTECRGTPRTVRVECRHRDQRPHIPHQPRNAHHPPGSRPAVVTPSTNEPSRHTPTDPMTAAEEGQRPGDERPGGGRPGAARTGGSTTSPPPPIHRITRGTGARYAAVCSGVSSVTAVGRPG